MLSQLETLRHALSREHKQARFIAVGSGKGGVGKTTISLSLAILLAQMGQKTLLVDADPGLADLNILLGINPEFHWGDYVRGEKSFSEIVLKDIHGMDFIHGFSGFKDGSALSAENAHKLMDALESEKSKYQWIIFDVGAGLSAANMVFLTRSDFVLLVLSSELTSLADAYGTLKTMRLQNTTQRFGVLVNQAEDAVQAKNVYSNLIRIANQFLGVRFPMLGWIPKDSTVPKALSRQKPLPIEYPECPFSLALGLIAQGLVQTVDMEVS